MRRVLSDSLLESQVVLGLRVFNVFRLRCLVAFFGFMFTCNPVISHAEDEKLTLADFATHIQTTYQAINSDTLRYANALKRTAEDGATVIDYYVTYQREGFENFTEGNGGDCATICQQFRASIVDLIQHQQDVLNLIPPAFGAFAHIQGLASPPSLPPADLSPLITVLNDAPAFILYPIYDGIEQLSGNANAGLDYLNQLYTTAEDALHSIVEVGNTASVVNSSVIQNSNNSTLSSSALETEVNSVACQVIADEVSLQQLLVAVPALKIFSVFLNVVGDHLILTGLRQVKKVEGGVSLVGELATAFDVNEVGTLGEILRVVGKVSEGFGNGLFRVVNRCRIRLNNQVVFCMLGEKNLHNNRTFDTHQYCLDRVKAGDTPFGFYENWLTELDQVP